MSRESAMARWHIPQATKKFIEDNTVELSSLHVPPEQYARFWSKVSFPSGGRGCWLWTGKLDRGGYGKFRTSIRNASAHVVSYSICIGDVPVGMELDHVRARGCVHRHCVNPAHLEPVTRRENWIRGESLSAINIRATHCKHGHALDEENIYRQPSKPESRNCRKCRARRTVEKRSRAAAIREAGL